ncbi:MAG: hypothetical protein M1812_005182 [Candelaria pacifica]|nr:MAG: hypothetical protein M1812_005182 [Candelaria pacifica]
MIALSIPLLLLTSTISSHAQSTSDTRNLPIVDLGYTQQQASSFNASGGYFNFTNIRYGEPPLGNLRFAAPVAAKENHTVQQGGQERECIQANPAWTLLAAAFQRIYATGNQAAITAFLKSPPVFNESQRIPPIGPFETEDCLFLDVSVPQVIFNAKSSSAGAPVLVWIFGGGYAFGAKNYWGNAAGLIDRSEDGVVYVSINYRLGAFGWLSGPTLQASNGTSNAGLLDQRLALEWVQKNIHLFGGDPNRVTVVGESAGGGSIMHHITAYGGKRGPAPFQQAVSQSGAFFPITSNEQQELSFNAFLNASNAKTIEEARALPLETLRNANSKIVSGSSYGLYTFGPVVDGEYVPALPGQLLLQGAFDKNVTLMIGHNANEGFRFTSPFVQTPKALNDSLMTSFPSIKPDILAYITEVLYPDKSPLYNTTLSRAALITSESSFSCNTNYLARAYDNATYNYLFTVPPALHGNDIPYTFFNGPSVSVANATVATALQTYIGQFVKNGVPAGGDGLPPLERYGDGVVLDLGNHGFITEADPADNDRCLWWQQAKYT